MLDAVGAMHDRQPATLGADKRFDDGAFFRTMEARAIEPHIPLVQEPRDPKSVHYQNQVPGVRARPR